MKNTNTNSEANTNEILDCILKINELENKISHLIYTKLLAEKTKENLQDLSFKENEIDEMIILFEILSNENEASQKTTSLIFNKISEKVIEKKVIEKINRLTANFFKYI